MDFLRVVIGESSTTLVCSYPQKASYLEQSKVSRCRGLGLHVERCFWCRRIAFMLRSDGSEECSIFHLLPQLVPGGACPLNGGFLLLCPAI